MRVGGVVVVIWGGGGFDDERSYPSQILKSRSLDFSEILYDVTTILRTKSSILGFFMKILIAPLASQKLLYYGRKGVFLDFL